MNVVRHQAVAEDRKLIMRSILAQQVEVERPLAVVSQNVTPRVRPLGYMVRHIDNDNASKSGHSRTLANELSANQAESFRSR